MAAMHDPGFSDTDWTTANQEYTYHREPHTGTQYIYTEDLAHDWLFTQPIDLDGGTSYDFSLWYITGGTSNWDDITVLYGTEQTIAAMTDDTIAFDNAIREAMNFYMLYPEETLIVVTADHECGGQTIGFAGTAYDTFFEVLAKQQYSYEVFDEYFLTPYKTNHAPAPTDIDADMWALIFDIFGFDGAGFTADEGDNLSGYQKEKLEAAFDKTMTGESVNSSEEDALLYDYYEPLTVTLTHILNQRAGIAWTSYSHTGVPVPVLAMGNGSTLFNGFYDNTDVAKKIAEAMGMTLINVENAEVVSTQLETKSDPNYKEYHHPKCTRPNYQN